ncbi:HAD family phosphatase [Streptomyces sp. NPDC088194]|uniref:HAD family hydrolase n=1 Tax=Streptomyces sp. NPDC088194 TaxID=3154931 RepID=UPI00344F9716
MTTACLILDIGGVLELTPRTGWDAAWERRLGLPAGAVDQRLEAVWTAGGSGAMTEPETRAAVSAELGLDPARTDAFFADLWTEYLGTPNTELIAYIRELKGICTLGILSNSFVGAREREEERYGFAALVGGADAVVYSHEIGWSKPDPRAFTLTCERLGARPADCLFVDDLAANVEAAQALGMSAVLHTDNATTRERIASHVAAAA